jgi:CDGSH-type Zn-finger protein
MSSTKPTVTIIVNGPYLVEGGLPLANQHVVTNEAGESIEWRQGKEFRNP